jgi:hypothetical protein
MLSISDLPDLRAPGPGPTTAELARRSSADEGTSEVGPGIAIVTHCIGDSCVDGLEDTATGAMLISAALSADEMALVGTDGSGWVERVVRVSYVSDRYVSAYIAESSFSGGAHANNVLSCATYDRAKARPAPLADVLGGAPHVLPDVQALLNDEDLSMEVLGTNSEGGLVVRGDYLLTQGARGPAAAVVLCADGSYPDASGSVLEIPLDQIPVEYLLR